MALTDAIEEKIAGLRAWRRDILTEMVFPEGMVVNDERRMGEDTRAGNIYRPEIGNVRQVIGSATVAGSPIRQVKHSKAPITVHELGNAQRRFANYARYRLLMHGKEYDEGTEQAFERMTPQRLIMELRDELADAVNYLTFLDVQLSRWQRTIEEADL